MHDAKRGRRVAVAAVREGFSAVKLRTCGAARGHDATAIKSVRGESGGAIALMLDEHQVLSVNEAMVRCGVPDDSGLDPIEESVGAQDFAGQAHVAHLMHAPVSIGENWGGLLDAAKNIAAATSDLMIPDAF